MKNKNMKNKNIKSIENYIGFKVGDLVEICQSTALQKRLEPPTIAFPANNIVLPMFVHKVLGKGTLLLCIWINEEPEDSDASLTQIGFLQNKSILSTSMFRCGGSGKSGGKNRIKKYIPT